MSLFTPNSLSIFAFTVSSSLYIGYRNISSQLKQLKADIVLRSRGDLTRRLDVSFDEISNQQMDALLEMHSVGSIEQVEDVIQRIVGVTNKIFRAQRISVMILNRKKTHVIVMASKDTEGKEIDATKGICGVVLSSGEMLNVKNAYADTRFNPECDVMTGFRTESLLCAPLVVNNETVGVMYVINKLDDDDTVTVFTEQDEKLFEFVTTTASSAIKKAQMYHDAVRKEKNAQALLSIVRSRTSEEELESVLMSTIDTIYNLLLPNCVSVFICDQVAQEAWVCVNKGVGDNVTVKYGQGIAGTVAANGQTLRIANAYEDSRFCDSVDRRTGYKTRSVLCAGVTGFASNSKPIAVVQLLNKLNGKPFTQDDEESLEMLCKELSTSLRRKVEEMSFLRRHSVGRNDPDQEKQLRLEESFLHEFGSISQSRKLAALIPRGSSERIEAIEVPARLSEPGASSLVVDDATAVKNREILSKWDFNPFTVSDTTLMQYSVHMIADFDLIATFNIDVRKLKSFIMGAHALYHDDAHFHNFKHAWSVMHMTYLILRHGASKYLTHLDILAALLSALCHDLDHPGTNNGYEVASQSELALTHSYDAVLERHHASMTHRLLTSPNSNILAHLTLEQQTYLCGVITETILATNMSDHFSHVERLETSSKNVPPFDVSSAASRRELVGHIVHAADLSGQVLPLELAKKWGDKCLAEFIHQAKLEKLNGYPVTEFMAALDTDLQCSRAQVGFVGTIVLPLWTALSSCFPSLDVRCCQAQSNHDYYTQCIQLATAAVNTSGETSTEE